MPSATSPASGADNSAKMVKEFVVVIDSVSKTVKFTANTDNIEVTCSVMLPDGNELSRSAPDANEAARSLLSALTADILASRVGEHWCLRYRHALEKSSTDAPENPMQLDECETIASGTKERQVTIGVSTKTSLHSAIGILAQERGVPVSVVARDMVVNGFEEFETRSFTESQSKLLASFESKLASYSDGESMQWMVRVNRGLATRIKLSAKEFGKSASQIAAMCITDALLKQTSTAALGAAPTEFESAKTIVGKYKGPAARKLAEEIGLGKRGPLLIGVLSGKTEAPRAVLRSLSLKLKVSIPLLKQVFNEAFLATPVPAFKAEDGKPEVRLTQQSWEDAVRSQGLTNEDTSALLEFAD